MPVRRRVWLPTWRPRCTAFLQASESVDAGLEGFEITADEADRLEEELEGAGRGQLLAHAREAANTALSRVKDRFSAEFNRGEGGMPRSWTPAVDIPAAAAAARRAAGLLLAQLCAARVDDGGRGPDFIETAVAQQLVEEKGPAVTGFDLQSAQEWPAAAVEPADVLLTPQQARSVWRQFISDSQMTVAQAVATQEANRAAQNRMPPLWALAAMIVLGFNEFVAVVRNPLLLLSLLVLFLFGRTVYQVSGGAAGFGGGY